MAQYHYDEAGNMAGYFLITFLALILLPLTLSFFNSPSKKIHNGCQCKLCINQRKRVNSRLKAYFSKKAYFLIFGWLILAYLSYKVANAKLDNKVYDPFEILEINQSASEKEIKSHFKKLSRKYHPDKVKVSVNQTLEAIQDRFVELTKAYKALTDETIRKNWLEHGHPDGRQDVSMGIALPKWIVEGRNNIWVLGVYGIIFGGALPAVVGRWWFGSRQKTRDGVNARSAATFFTSLQEESTMEEVVGAFSKAYQWELPGSKSEFDPELTEIETEIEHRAGSKWEKVKRLCGEEAGRRALVLIYAHLLRIPVNKSNLRKEQTQMLLQTPTLLGAFLNVSVSRNWLLPTLAVMRFHAYLAQALLPGVERMQFAQLPGIKTEELTTLVPDAEDIIDVVDVLEGKQDGRFTDIKKAVEKWGRIVIVDAAFKVIGERVVTPSSIVFLVVKLRIVPPLSTKHKEKDEDVEGTKRIVKLNEERDEQFLTSRNEAEDLPSNDATITWAHAPYWPGERKPSWWIVLADEKSNRVVVPPMKISDVPFSQPGIDRNYRSYKLQFQSPQTVGMFIWKVQLISDTFVGEDASWDITLKIEDPSTLNVDDQPSEDEISDPDEDTIAGQMAAMRGGPVKKRNDDEDESDYESSTDDDKDSDNSSDSDSD